MNSSTSATRLVGQAFSDGILHSCPNGMFRPGGSASATGITKITCTDPQVVGLDLSIAATGIADGDGGTATVRSKATDGDHRLLRIAEVIGQAVGVGEQCAKADLAVLEDLPKHAHSAGITGMVHGIVRAVLLTAGVPYAVLPPATLKAYATGSGAASKTDMAMAAYKRAGAEFADDNQCDAWWLRAAGLDWLGAPPFTLPARHRIRLAKATWPDCFVSPAQEGVP